MRSEEHDCASDFLFVQMVVIFVKKIFLRNSRKIVDTVSVLVYTTITDTVSVLLDTILAAVGLTNCKEKLL